MAPSPGQGVSIADVAQRAQVSTMTVSRVLNESGPVSEGTRLRVLKAVAALRYQPNSAAQTLSSGRSRTIGVITLEGSVDGPTSTLAGIEQHARAAGYSVSVSILQQPTPASIAAAVSHLRSQSVAGIVLSAPHTGLDDSLIPTSTVPMVAVEGMHGRSPVVTVDQHRGAVLATQHLTGLGHRVIGHIAGPDDRFEALEREAGWRQTVKDAGLVPGPMARGDWSPRSGYELAERLFSESAPTALFCANDLMAIGAIRYLTEQGLTVPTTVSVVGFDDIPEAAYLTPSLTTVRYNFYALGREALRRLIADIRQPDPADPGEVRTVLDPSLVKRESSGPVP